MTTAVRCAHHPERAALGYCSACGKALCAACLVRLSTGNYCETCANPPARPRPARRFPWWAIVLAVLVVLVLLRAILR